MNKQTEVSNIENAIADVKRQLRAESKSELIRKFIGLYAQMVKLQLEVNKLNEKLNAKTVVDTTEGTKND